LFFFFFFFQAEDGIRDLTVTGVQTCALPIYRCGFCYLATDGLRMPYRMKDPAQIAAEFEADGQPYAVFVDNNLGSNREYLYELRSEERRVGKECRYRRLAEH